MIIQIKTYDDPELRQFWLGFVDVGPYTIFFPTDGGDPVLHNRRAIQQDDNGRAYATCKPSEWPRISRQLREAEAIKQEDLAGALGFRSAATISHYESGKRHVNVDELEAIAAALGYNVELRLTQRG